MIHKHLRSLYVQHLRHRLRREIVRQRLKLVYYVWGYWPIFLVPNVSPTQKISLLWRFLLVDWHIVHSHRPFEISVVCRALAERHARSSEILLEAGCFNGGSSAKFSIMCAMLGYNLCIFDSFEGVEEMTDEEKGASYDFSGQYKALEETVRENIKKYGEIGVCSFYKGWFKDTLAVEGAPKPVRVAYIDCDLATGTREVLQGIVPALVSDGWIFSEDYHIQPVFAVLHRDDTWLPFGKGLPTIVRLGEKIAGIRFPNESIG